MTEKQIEVIEDTHKHIENIKKLTKDYRKNNMKTYNNINEVQPTKSCKCKVITNRGETLEVYYDDYYPIFFKNNGDDIGWKDNGHNPELVIKWIEIDENS